MPAIKAIGVVFCNGCFPFPRTAYQALSLFSKRQTVTHTHRHSCSGSLWRVVSKHFFIGQTCRVLTLTRKPEVQRKSLCAGLMTPCAVSTHPLKTLGHRSMVFRLFPRSWGKVGEIQFTWSLGCGRTCSPRFPRCPL